MKDVPSDPKNSYEEVERGKFADSMLRKYFYAFGALLDLFDANNVDGKHSKQFFQDVVIERMLDQYQYLRVDLSPKTLKIAYNDMLKEAYPNRKCVVDLEVDKLRHLN